MSEKEPVVILCGGMGTRLKEETEFRPKPLVPIGGMPILWHIMKIYSHYGHNDFILCLGYKGEMIKDFFLHYDYLISDLTYNLRTKQSWSHDQSKVEDWNITFANTGLKTATGARVKKIEKYVDKDNFMLTYGDGVSDVNIKKLSDFHESHGKIGTVTSVRPLSRFGLLTMKENQVIDFTKKTLVHDGWIDGGFFKFKKDMFDYLSHDEDCMLESDPLKKLARDGEFMAYKHEGFWQCMDTIRHQDLLNDMWKSNPKWKVWK